MIKKVLVVEYWTQEGHRNLFNNICGLLKRGGFDVYAVVPDNYMADKIEGTIIRTGLRYYNDECKNGTINRLRYSIQVQKLTNRIAKQEGIEIIYIVTYETLGLAIGNLLCKGKVKQVIIHNNNIDAIEIIPAQCNLLKMIKYRLLSVLYRQAFNFIKNDVIHLVLAGFIKLHLITEYSIDRNKIVVIPHPMYNLGKSAVDNKYDLVGISSGNDEFIIDQLIKEENNNHIFSNNNLQVVLKSHRFSYDDGFLKVIKGFIPDKDFDNYISGAKCILAPYPQIYKYRMSAILVDAMANNKPVIGTSIPVILNAANIYKNSIRIFNISTLVEDLFFLRDDSNEQIKDFEEFKSFRDVNMLSRLITDNVENAITGVGVHDIFDF